MGWKNKFSIVWRTFVFAIHPIPHAEQWYGVMSGFVALLIVLGLIGAPIAGAFAPSPLPDPSPRWPLIFAYPATLAFLLAAIAAIRLQFRLTAITGGPKILRAGDVVRGLDFNLSAFLQTQGNEPIANITFDRCTLHGPCLATLVGTIEMNGCSFSGGPGMEELIFEVSAGGKVAGVAAFVHCKFLYCDFKDISWALTKPIADTLRAIVKT